MSAYDVYIQQHQTHYVEELITFCRQPSLSATGHGMETMAQMVARRLQQLGANVKTLTVDNSYPYVWAEIGSGKSTLLLYNHYDVQPARYEDGWTHPPFTPVIYNGQLFARGVADNKANLLFRIQAVESYMAAWGELPFRIVFFVEGEEEIGSLRLPAFVQKYPSLVQADGCIWESGRKGYAGRPELVLGLRGIWYGELSLRADSREPHSSWANIIANPAIPLVQRLCQVVESLTDGAGQVAFSDLSPDSFPIAAEDLELLGKIPFDLSTLAQKHHLTLYPDLTPQEALRRLLFTPSCNVCGLGVGYTEPGVKTIIPNRAFVKIDMRLPVGLTPDEAETQLRRHLSRHGFGDVEVKRLLGLDAARTSPNSAIAQAVQRAVEKCYNVAPIVYPLMPASGPMYDLCQVFGTPTISFGAGHPADNVHDVDENIYLDDYFAAMRCFGEIIRQFALLHYNP